MSRHTPGPWNLATYTDEDTQIDVIAGEEVVTVSGRVQAKWVANLDIECTECGRAEFEANARLIAAAPELLEAAWNLAAAFQAFWFEAVDEPVGTCKESAYLNALAVIAKAEGREPLANIGIPKTADPYLIAAAPELLEALRCMLERFGHDRWNSVHDVAAVQYARAAVARATNPKEEVPR